MCVTEQRRDINFFRGKDCKSKHCNQDYFCGYKGENGRTGCAGWGNSADCHCRQEWNGENQEKQEEFQNEESFEIAFCMPDMFNRSSDTVPDHVRFFSLLIADYGWDGKRIASAQPEKIQPPSEQCLPLDEGKKESAFDQNPVIAESPDHFAVKDAEQEGGKDTADQDLICLMTAFSPTILQALKWTGLLQDFIQGKELKRL